MKNCTKHFIERWVERIVGITVDKQAKEYISLNQEMIKEHANKSFDFAQFVYKGQLGDNITRNYYIKDDMVFVTNTTDDAFITIYKVDLGFTDELNATVRKGLLEEIERLRKEEEEIELEILMELENKEFLISALDDEIKIVEEQLKALIENKKFIEEEVKNIKKRNLNVGLEIKRHTQTLINSKDYKKDLQTMK